jgi:acyl-CoA thioester hydrolase
MDSFQISARIEVRWKDLDPLGHVNNAVYFTYFEIARGRFFDRVFRRDESPGLTCFLVTATCDFLAPIQHREMIEVGIRIPIVGRTSFVFEYEVRKASNAMIVARGHSTQILYDRLTDKKLVITDDRLADIERLQGEAPRRREGDD